MAFDPGLAERCREVLFDIHGLDEKKMFGGIGFLVNGNIACGVHGDRLIVRVGAEQHQKYLTLEHVHPFDITGRPMSGWIMVDPDGLAEDTAVGSWVSMGLDFARTLPPK